jgi:hypothetical protein
MTALNSSSRTVDIVAYDRDGKVLLLAEAKSRYGTSEAWATQLRRNILAHGALPSSKYFLIATPERMYVWRGQQPGAVELAPEGTIDAASVFHRYFQRLQQEPSNIAPRAFELVVLAWLTDIAHTAAAESDQRPSSDDSAAAWLVELRDSLREARIEAN